MSGTNSPGYWALSSVFSVKIQCQCYTTFMMTNGLAYYAQLSFCSVNMLSQCLHNFHDEHFVEFKNFLINFYDILTWGGLIVPLYSAIFSQHTCLNLQRNNISKNHTFFQTDLNWQSFKCPRFRMIYSWGEFQPSKVGSQIILKMNHSEV